MPIDAANSILLAPQLGQGATAAHNAGVLALVYILTAHALLTQLRIALLCDAALLPPSDDCVR
jgi:hypothetical protein